SIRRRLPDTRYLIALSSFLLGRPFHLGRPFYSNCFFVILLPQFSMTSSLEADQGLPGSPGTQRRDPATLARQSSLSLQAGYCESTVNKNASMQTTDHESCVTAYQSAKRIPQPKHRLLEHPKIRTHGHEVETPFQVALRIRLDGSQDAGGLACGLGAVVQIADHALHIGMIGVAQMAQRSRQIGR